LQLNNAHAAKLDANALLFASAQVWWYAIDMYINKHSGKTTQTHNAIVRAAMASFQVPYEAVTPVPRSLWVWVADFKFPLQDKPFIQKVMTSLYPQECLLQPQHCKLSACSQNACTISLDDSNTH